ncbi:MAG: hypothetical protein SF182_18520 [Deltaproteobacteria bacterium]|nr:hypothetical protein [Deltaproteobacteria bacterium]
MPPSPRQQTPLSVRLRERLYLLGHRRRLRRIAPYHHPDADAAAVLARVRDKHLVMAITAGRSGSTYVARLLASLPDITSPHEAPPHYGYMMRLAQHDPEAARRFLLQYKLPTIAAAPTRRYADISHLFCKGFFTPLLGLDVVPDLILLRRHPRAVAQSWLTRRAVPGRDRRGLRLHLHPGDPDVLPFPDWATATDYQLCFWYALEIERRQRDYGARAMARGARVVDVTADELHDGARFVSVITELGLLPPGADAGALLARHAEISAVQHKPNAGPSARVRVEEEARVWDAVAPAAPWLPEAVERRYAARAGSTATG